MFYQLKKGTFIAKLSVSTRLSLINCLSPLLEKVLGGAWTTHLISLPKLQLITPLHCYQNPQVI